MIDFNSNTNLHNVEIGNNSLFLADCFDVFPLIPDKCIDVIIADLPYGTTNCSWDSILPLDKLWQEYDRVLKENGVVVLTSTEPFTSILIQSNIQNYKYCWYWDRRIRSNFLNSKYQPLRHIETIVVFYKKKPTYNPILKPKRKESIRWNDTTDIQKQTDTLSTVGYLKTRHERREIPPDMEYPTEFIQFSLRSPNKGRYHPTEKPVELMEYLINTYTNENETVLDNTMGSGTTGVACTKINRKFIGIEKEQKYYDIATARIQYEIDNPLKEETGERIETNKNSQKFW